MGNEKYDVSPYPYWIPPLTDQQVSEMRGVFHRGLGDEAPQVEHVIDGNGTMKILSCAEDISSKFVRGNIAPGNCKDEEGYVVACDESDQKNKTKPLNPVEIQSLVQLSSSYSIFSSKTGCLLQVASIIEKNLSDELYKSSPDAFFSLVGTIVQITETIIQRTKAPYQIWFDYYQPLDARILDINPVNHYRKWKDIERQQSRIRAGKYILDPRKETPEPRTESALLKSVGEWQKVRDDLLKQLEPADASKQIAAKKTGDIPKINEYIEKSLKHLRISDLEAQTLGKYPYWERDDIVYSHVNYMIYHSVVSVVLDKEGNPAYEKDFFPYALLIRPQRFKEFPMMRIVSPPGLYLSIDKGVDKQLVVTDDLKVTPIPVGDGPVGFVRVFAAKFHEHPFKTELQTFFNRFPPHVLPQIIVDAALGTYNVSPITLYLGMEKIIPNIDTYAVEDIKRRLEYLYVNYADVLAKLGLEMLKSIVTEIVRNWVIKTLLKKIGAKFIPGVNVISAIEDALDDEGIDWARTIIWCLMMAGISEQTDDITIATKVFTKAAVDKVQCLIVAEVQKRASKILILRPPKSKLAKVDSPSADTASDKPHDPAARGKKLGDATPADSSISTSKAGADAPIGQQPKPAPPPITPRGIDPASQATADKNIEAKATDASQEPQAKPTTQPTSPAASEAKAKESTATDSKLAATDYPDARKTQTVRGEKKKSGSNQSQQAAADPTAKSDTKTQPNAADSTKTGVDAKATPAKPKQPKIHDPHNMRPGATNFDRQTAETGGIESIGFYKDPDGRYAVKIKGTLQEGLHRGDGPAPAGKTKAPNYNDKYPVTNKQAGLDSNWENAHLWGPGFGDEAAAGMMKAPKSLNQWYQNEGAEGWMRDLRKQAIRDGGPLARVELEATAIAWDLTGHKWQPKTQVDFLRRVEYRVTLKLPNKSPQSIRVTIDVDVPPSTKILSIDIDPPDAANPADLFSVHKK